MIPPEILDSLSRPVVEVYAQATDALMINIARHFNVSALGNTPSFEWEVQKLAELGQLTLENAAIIAKTVAPGDETVALALRTSMADALKAAEPALADAAAKGLIFGASEPNPQASPSVMQMLRNYEAQATDKRNLVNTVMLNSSLEQYRKVVRDTVQYEAQLEAAQSILNESTGEVLLGVTSRQQAARQAVAKMAKEGLTGFIDKGNHRWSPEAYVNMDIRTTITNVAHQSTWARGDDYGVDLISVSIKAASREKCYPWQGKVLSRGNQRGTTQDLDGNSIPYIPMSETSYGEPDGIFGINCGHFSNIFIPGYSKLRGEVPPKAENDAAYALSQQQRELERNVRYAKRDAAMADAMKDDAAFRKAALAVRDKQSLLDAFISENDLTKRSDRTQVFGYNKGVSGRAVQVASAMQKARETNALVSSSGNPKKLTGLPDETLKSTSPVDTPGLKGIVPKGSALTGIEVQAGKGTSAPIKDLARLAAENPGYPLEEWQKKSGKVAAANHRYTIHWYENNGYAPEKDVKTKGVSKL